MATAKVVIKDNSIRLLKINGALTLAQLQAIAGTCPDGGNCLGDVCFGVPLIPDVDASNPTCNRPGTVDLCFNFTPNSDILTPGDFNDDFNSDFLIAR
jgi:hypothetical protein